MKAFTDYEVFARFMARWTAADHARYAVIERRNYLAHCPFVDLILDRGRTHGEQGSDAFASTARGVREAACWTAIPQCTDRGEALARNTRDDAYGWESGDTFSGEFEAR